MIFGRLLPILLIFFSCLCTADPISPTWDRDRLAGFLEHVEEQKTYDREREKGRTAFNEETEAWDRARRAAAVEHKKQIKEQSPQEGGPEHLADLKEKRAVVREAEEIRLEFIRQKKSVMGHGTFARSVSEEVELGLAQSRPRYQLKKRVLYGARGRVKSGGSSYGAGSLSGGSSLPSPSFDDLPAGDSYSPPPVMPDFEGSDFPPPPPPPPPAFEDGGEFPPPPPSPVPDFGGEFPAPPPPPPTDFGGF